MARDVLAQPLRHLALFQGLTPLQITEIARRADRIRYKPGDSIVVEGRAEDSAVVLVSGTAERISGPGISDFPEPVPAGAIISEMSMLVETEVSSTVVAATEIRALRISREELHRQMAEDPVIAEHFISRISARLGEIAAEMRAIDAALGGGESDYRAGDLPPPNSQRADNVDVALLH